MSNLDSDSLRVEPLGHDRKNSAYWYFYGTRLYREDYIDTSDSVSHKQKSKPRDKKRKRRRNRVAKEEEEEEEKKEDSLISGEGKESVWQVVCFTQQDWSRLVEKFRDSVIISSIERYLPYRLSYFNDVVPRRSTIPNVNSTVLCPRISCLRFRNCST